MPRSCPSARPRRPPAQLRRAPQLSADRRLYAGASLIVAVIAATAGGTRSRPLVFAAVLLTVVGTSLAGMTANVPLWLLALAPAAVGIGIANTGSLGLLVQAVPAQHIVTAMVVWSQIGIIGYLLGPLVGGLVADNLGYAYVGTVSAVAGLVVVVLFNPRRTRRIKPRDGAPTRPLGERRRAKSAASGLCRDGH